MTKAEEIEILKRAACELGNDSYLGPWLTRAIPNLAQDIASDFSPVSYGEAERIAYSRIQDAEKAACEIVAEAERQAVAIRSEANATAARWNLEAKRRLMEFAEEL